MNTDYDAPPGSGPASPQDRNRRFLLLFLGLVAACCLCGGLGLVAINFAGSAVLENFMLDDPQEMSATARSIVEFDMPPGYQVEVGMDIVFGQMVLLSAEQGELQPDSPPIIFLMGLSSTIDPEDEQIRRQILVSMRRAMNQQDFETNLVDQKTLSLLDQPVDAFYYEGSFDDGTPLRQVMTEPFKGENGTVIIMILGPAAGWDAAMVDDFLGSVR